MSTSAPVRISGYDAANTDGQRSQLLFPTNSRTEYSVWTRSMLLAKNRALEANFPFITRIKQKFGRHVAGKGIFPCPTTTDVEWNLQAKALFESWASNKFTYSVDGSRDLWDDQRFIAEELGAGDGETFEVLTKRNGMPSVQPLDPYEIGSIWIGSAPPGGSLFYEDGVRYDEYLKPVSYLVGELSPSQVYAVATTREVAAANMIHVYRRRRAKQFRGLPPLYSGMNDGHDALDLSALAKASAKLHSLLAVSKRRVPKNTGKGVGAQIEKVLGADGTTVDRIDEKFKGGAVTVELDADEELELHASERPTIAELDGIKFYCHMVALAADLPFSVVFSFLGVGGTATRADLEDAQSTFELRQDHLIWAHSQPIYVWRLAIAMETGELPRCKDPNWWKADWHGPAKITVDYGRSAQANIDLSRNGMMSHERYFEERGMDARDELTKQIQLLKWLKTECATAGVDINLILEATPGSLQKPASGAPAPSDE